MVSGHKPFIVSWRVSHREKLITDEVQRSNGDALLRGIRFHVVLFLEVGYESKDLFKLATNRRFSGT